jgi:hypothetical protein
MPTAFSLSAPLPEEENDRARISTPYVTIFHEKRSRILPEIPIKLATLILADVKTKNHIKTFFQYCVSKHHSVNTLN